MENGFLDKKQKFTLFFWKKEKRYDVFERGWSKNAQ